MGATVCHAAVRVNQESPSALGEVVETSDRQQIPTGVVSCRSPSFRLDRRLSFNLPKRTRLKYGPKRCSAPTRRRNTESEQKDQGC